MKSIIDRPMKHLLQNTVLWSVFALSAASQWTPLNAAGLVQEQVKGNGGGRPQPKAHRREPAKPAEHSKAEAKHEALVQKKIAKEARHAAPKVAAPHESPKVTRGTETPKTGREHEGSKFVGFRRPIALRSLEVMARLRRELFGRRWSFVYAASLKHAPKSVRFLQNGMVETEVKGEFWYWEPLDGRRISLRTLADQTEPPVTLEFDEGFTNFRYVLPNQTVAVQGSPLDAIAEAPAFVADGGQPATLEQALLASQWNWSDATDKSNEDIRFEKSKCFRLAGKTSYWNVTGPRTVHVEFESGSQTDLLFDMSFSVYTDGNQISGFRETPDANASAAASNNQQ